MQRRSFLASGAAGLALLSAPRRAGAAPPGDVLRLNFNENPLGLSPAARRAVIDGLPEGNRYPAAARADLERTLAELHGVGPEHLVVGAGSTDVLRMAVQASAAPHARFVIADPTFEDIEGYGMRFGVAPVKVPLTRDGGHDLDRMRRATAGIAPALVFLCNPNNPTGTLTPSAHIDAWIADARRNVRFIVDEAYFEYVDDPSYWSALAWVKDRPNVIVIRTFSKIYGMAGMRLGYGIAHPETAAALRRHQGRNNVSHVTLVAALASLRDQDLVPRARAANREARDILLHVLEELGLEHLPSHTNFVMHQVPGDLETYIERMREHDVLVGRPFAPMLAWSRVSLGTPAEMERFATVLREFREKGWV